MNYFELYPGDYLRDTTRLTLVEHGAYLRLLMAYYGEEKPLPAEPADLFVIVSAISAADKAAVRKVADRFFPVGEDGLRHNGRADEEILKAQRRIETARQNGAKGGRKPNPAGNPPGNPAGNPMGSPRGNPAGTQRGTHSGEALHTPHAIHQKPEDQEPKQSAASGPSLSVIPSTEGSVGANTLTPAEVCVALRQAGVGHVSPSYQPLREAIAAGCTLKHFTDATAKAKPHQRNLAYIVAKAHGSLTDAKANGAQQSDLEATNRAKAAQWAASQRDDTLEEDHAAL